MNESRPIVVESEVRRCWVTPSKVRTGGLKPPPRSTERRPEPPMGSDGKQFERRNK